MKIATLERFSEPSRRCEPRRIADAEDEVITWDLALPPNRVRYLLERTPAWLTCPMALGERWTLLCACLNTRGARLGALAQGPDLWHRVRAGEIDRLALFSARGFPLATLLADQTHAAAHETIARGTKYFGEFAFELQAVIPYAYWLHRQGLLEFTISTADTRCLYCFSPNHEERPVPRRYVPITEYPAGQAGKIRYDRLGFPASLDTPPWLPPPAVRPNHRVSGRTGGKAPIRPAGIPRLAGHPPVAAAPVQAALPKRPFPLCQGDMCRL